MTDNKIETNNSEVIENNLEKIFILVKNLKTEQQWSTFPLKEELASKCNLLVREIEEIVTKGSPELKRKYEMYLQYIIVAESKNNIKFREKILESYDFDLENKKIPDIQFITGDQDNHKKILDAIIAQSEIVAEMTNSNVEISGEEEIDNLLESEDLLS